MENHEYENQVVKQTKSENTILRYVLMGLVSVLLLCAGFYLGTQYKTDKNTENTIDIEATSVATETDTENVVTEAREELNRNSEVVDDFGIQYINSEWGYQINYPEGWVVGEERIVLDRVNQIHSLITFSSPDETQRITVGIYDDSDAPSGYTHPNFAPIVEEISIDGTTFPVSVFPKGYECGMGDQPRDDCSFFHIAIPRDATTVTITASGKAETVTPEYKEILKTFKTLKFDETLPEKRIAAIPYDLQLATVRANQTDGENIVVSYIIDNNSAHKYESDVTVVLRETFTKNVLATDTVPGYKVMKDEFNTQRYSITAAKKDISVTGNIDVEIVIDPQKTLNESNYDNNVSQIAPLL